MANFSPGSIPKTYTPSGGGSGYGSYYNPSSPSFYNPKEPYQYKPPQNPKLPSVKPGDPTSPPKPITKTPYPNLKQPVSIPKLPTLTPLKPISPIGGGLPAGVLPGGGLAGGLAAGAALLWAYNFYNLYKLWNLSQPESVPTPRIPSSEEGIEYNVAVTAQIYAEIYFDNNPNDGNPYDTYGGRTEYLVSSTKTKAIGKIGELRVARNTGLDGYSIELFCQQTTHSAALKQPRGYDWHPIGLEAGGPFTALITSGKFWKEGEPEPTTQQPELTQVPPSRQAQPLPKEAVPQLSKQTPPTIQPDPTPSLDPIPQKPPIRLQIPNNQPLTFTSPGNPPLIINQIPPRATPEQPRLPEQPTEINFPRTTPPGQPQPIEIRPPGAAPITFTGPGNTPITINIPGFQPITVDPRNTSQPIGATPQLLVPGSFIPNPTTSPRPTPTPTDPPTPEPELPDILIPATILATLTPLLQQIVANTSPSTVAPLVSASVCRTTQPGGCMANLANDTANKVNQNTNNGLEKILNNTSNLANLTLLPTINNKLGDQVPGGLSGFLQRAYQATHIDKALNAMNTVLLVHNAAMLSRNLGSTLGDLTSQALSTIGIKDAEGSPIDINKEIGTQVNSFMENLVGKEVWTGTKISWNKANAIISSATQIVYTVRSIADSGREVTEWIANNTGKIGNALKRFRVVGENAYPHLSENVSYQNAWMLKLQRYREGVDSLDDAASSLQGVLGEVQNIQQEFGELQEQKQRFDKAITDVQPKMIPDNTPVKAQRETALTASKAPNDAATVFRGEGESPSA